MKGKLVVYFKCLACSVLFPTEENFFLHCKSLHCEETVVFEKTDDDDSEDADLTVANDSNGFIEDIKEIHLETHETGQENYNDENETAIVHNDSQAVLSKSSNGCPEGPSATVSRGQEISGSTNALNRHNKNTVCERYSRRAGYCGICEKFYKRLDTHMSDVHRTADAKRLRNERKAGYCKICSKQYKNLVNHNWVYHTRKKKPISCKVCPASFLRKDELETHVLQAHSGESCEICGKSFKHLARKQAHMRLHANERNFLCSLCGKSYKTKYSLMQHSLSHGNDMMQCNICGAKIKYSTNLRLHMKIHEGIKPHQCEYCGKSFTLKINLISHIRGHTGERPFKCEVCGKSFKRSQSVKKHRCVGSIISSVEKVDEFCLSNAVLDSVINI